MASVTLTTPPNDATVPHTFTAGGAYAITELTEENGVNSVRSTVTQNGTTLDTRTFIIPNRQQSGPWSVTHEISGTSTLTGCTVTATLLVNAIETASANSDNITISG